MKIRYKIYLSLGLLFISTAVFAQQVETKHIRIVDTLTSQEKVQRNPIILQAEVDSLINQFNSTLPKLEIAEPVKYSSQKFEQVFINGLSSYHYFYWELSYSF